MLCGATQLLQHIIVVGVNTNTQNNIRPYSSFSKLPDAVQQDLCGCHELHAGMKGLSTALPSHNFPKQIIARPQLRSHEDSKSHTGITTRAYKTTPKTSLRLN